LFLFTVSSCNVSGMWKEYDEDIDFACQTYKNKHKFFKNIFCYICNPPVTSGEISRIINITFLFLGVFNDFGI
jgi:hypothetical protein